MQQIRSRKIETGESFPFEFTICTLVTNSAEYQEMLQSFVNMGFDEETCEFIYIDNSTANTFEAYAGLNRFLREAKGKYIILCHQDILLNQHGRTHLLGKIQDIEKVDPEWAVLGNAGGLNVKHRGLHLTNQSGKEWHEPNLPLRAQTLDENFIVARKSANLSLSADLQGFHFYGADICLVADVLGYTCYVIDFKLIHKSDGNDDERFYQLKKQFIKKYRRAFRSRFISTTITRFYISGNKLLNIIGNTGLILFFARQYYKIFKPKEKYHSKSKL